MKHTQMLSPLNTSGRTASQIVLDAEMSWLRPYLVETDETAKLSHPDTCRCERVCLQAKLDEMLRRSEEWKSL